MLSGKKPVRKDYIVNDSIHVKCLKQTKGGDERGKGVTVWGFFFEVMKNFVNVDCNGFRAVAIQKSLNCTF